MTCVSSILSPRAADKLRCRLRAHGTCRAGASPNRRGDPRSLRSLRPWNAAKPVAAGLADLHVVVKYESDWGLDDLRDVVRTGTTPIVGIDLRPVEGLFAFHAVVVLDITAEQVIAHDPLYQEGSRLISLTTFEAAWNKADRETVIILPYLMGLAI